MKKFFEKHKEETDIIITDNGVPVKSSEVTDYIKGILVENLKICTKEAEKRIKISRKTIWHVRIFNELSKQNFNKRANIW